MEKELTKAEAQAWLVRWEAVEEAERQLQLSASAMEKLRQLASLMASVKALGWAEALAAEEDEVRDRWVRLREALCDRA